MTGTFSYKPLALTLGDPAGIGPEITAKSWLDVKDSSEFTFAIIAPYDIIAKSLAGIDAPAPVKIDSISSAFDIFPNALPVIDIEGFLPKAGHPDSKAAPTVMTSIQMAVKLCLNADADAVVTNPIAKDILYAAGFKHPGHTEYLGELTKNTPSPYRRGPVMMLSGGGLRVALATVHLPLLHAAEQLKSVDIISNARVMHDALIRDFGIEKPRIAVTGLNPHAGEGGALGREEIEIINPAVEILRNEGLTITNAQPADTLFHEEARQTYDAVLAMYHDQGLSPVKTLDFYGGVNITLGLPIVRTSPDHGTAFNIAGHDLARPDSLIAAIKMARKIADNRKATSHG